MKKILYLFDGFGKGGAQVAFTNLLPQMLNDEFQISLVILSESKSEMPIPKGLEESFRLNARSTLDFKALLRLKDLVKQGQYDFLVANLFWSQMWSSLVLGRSSKLVWIEHNTYENRSFPHWVIYKLLSRKAKVLSVSNDVRDFLLNHRIKSEVVYNPVLTHKFESFNEKRNQDFIFAGRLNSQKRPELAIKAFNLFLSENPAKRSQSNLWICGDGPQRILLESLTQDLGLSGNIKFLGDLDQSKLFLKMSCSSTLVSTSLIEGFSLVRVEAAAHGMCVVSTNTGALIETLSPYDSDCGFFVAESNIESLANMMQESLLDYYWNAEKIIERADGMRKFSPEAIFLEYQKNIFSVTSH